MAIWLFLCGWAAIWLFPHHIYLFFFSGLCMCEHIHTDKPETTGSESCLYTFQAEMAGAPTESVLKLCIYGIIQRVLSSKWVFVQHSYDVISNMAALDHDRFHFVDISCFNSVKMSTTIHSSW